MKTDSQIQSDVIQELKWDPKVTHTAIGVAVKDAIVTLSGHVPAYAEKLEAVNAAERVEGVKAVVEQIDVKAAGEYRRDDEAIAAAVVNALQWNAQVPSSIKAEVEHGRVTLRGQVQWAFQRTAAENAVRYLSGVVSVANLIAIKPQVNASAVKHEIEDALKRMSEEEARQITVEVSGNRVSLSGRVHSFSERKRVEDAAWFAPGVTSVESNLKISPWS